MANIEHITVGDTTYDIKDSQILTNLIDNVGTGSVRHVEAVSSSNPYAFAEGNGTTAVGRYSHAEGYNTTASGDYSHAEGCSTTASGYYSHAEGWNTTASAAYSHAEGYNTVASGLASHAQGYYTTASSSSQFVCGKYNIVDSSGKFGFIVGNGTTSSNRHNEFAVDWTGKIYIDRLRCNDTNFYYGYIVNSAATTVSTVGTTAKAVTSVTLCGGIWICWCGVRVTGAGGKYLRASLETTSGSSAANVQLPTTTSSSANNQIQFCKILYLDSSETYYLNVQVGQSSSLESTGTYINAMKVD